VRDALEERMGGRVLEAVTQPQGFSPGLAARMRLDDGRRVFVKAVGEEANPDTPGIHRREARVLAALPAVAPAPRLLWTYDARGWVALGLEDIDGRHPHEPWTEADLRLVLTTLLKMARDLTPSPIAVDETAAQGFERDVNGWQVALARGETRLDAWSRKHLARLGELESRAPAAAEGDTLLHFDARADNLLIAGDRVYVVDWPWARTGAWWIDLLLMAPSVAMQGGPSPESFLGRLDLKGVARDALDAVICTMAGYFVVRALEPDPPGIPTVRAFQAAQGRVAMGWLRERLGWD
jgi:aminoglycoside phosphotransferase (APT) family kinase protein